MYGSQFRIVERYQGSFEVHRRISFLGLSWWRPIREIYHGYMDSYSDTKKFGTVDEARAYAESILPEEELARRARAIEKATFPKVVETL